MAEDVLEKLKKEATKMGIPFDDEKVTESELSEEIEKKKEAEKQEKLLNEEKQKKADDYKKKHPLILKNVFMQDVDEKDYFWPGKDKDKKTVYAPVYFNKICGFPVDREDMIEVFNKIFNPDDNFLFYKIRDKEIYIIVVPIKFSSIVGPSHENATSDFQKHAISFIGEGSVNLDTLKRKLQAIATFVRTAEK